MTSNLARHALASRGWRLAWCPPVPRLHVFERGEGDLGDTHLIFADSEADAWRKLGVLLAGEEA